MFSRRGLLCRLAGWNRSRRFRLNRAGAFCRSGGLGRGGRFSGRSAANGRGGMDRAARRTIEEHADRSEDAHTRCGSNQAPGESRCVTAAHPGRRMQRHHGISDRGSVVPLQADESLAAASRTWPEAELASATVAEHRVGRIASRTEMALHMRHSTLPHASDRPGGAETAARAIRVHSPGIFNGLANRPLILQRAGAVEEVSADCAKTDAANRITFHFVHYHPTRSP
jgi:hypothetical protein